MTIEHREPATDLSRNAASRLSLALVSHFVRFPRRQASPLVALLGAQEDKSAPAVR